jgi:carbonic anhydrase/acetyltransferase-like protein (isoleucine patch superfamily)
MIIPDRSFAVGVPAEIKGRVNRQQLWWVEEGSPLYHELAKQYKEQGL